MTFYLISLLYKFKKQNYKSISELIKRKRTAKVVNEVIYVRTYVGERLEAIKNSEKPSRRKKLFRDKVRNEIMGEFSYLERYRVFYQ